MKWMEDCQAAKGWFEQGRNMGASHLIVFYNTLEQEHRPLFVFPEQDIELEVLKILRVCKGTNTMMVGVLSLVEDVNNVDAIFRPINVAISRIEN